MWAADMLSHSYKPYKDWHDSHSAPSSVKWRLWPTPGRQPIQSQHNSDHVRSLPECTRHVLRFWADLDMGRDVFTQAETTEIKEASGREVQKLQWTVGPGDLGISISRQVLFIL